MRRSGLRRGAKPLKRAGPLARGDSELKRSVPLRSKAVGSRAGRIAKLLEDDVLQAPAHAEWTRKVTRWPCALCKNAKAWPRDPHHVLPARYIKDYVRGLRLGDRDTIDLLRVLLWDTRNGVCLCRGCHENHENAKRPLPRHMVPAAAREFAAEIGLEWVLDRLYPEAA